MATTIVTKNGSGPPAVGDLVQGELAVDLTNKTLYSKDSSGNVFKVGDTGGGSPGTFTDLVATDSFTSPGIDDTNDPSGVAITIDADAKVGIGTGINSPTYQVDIYDGPGAQNIFRARQSGSTNGFSIKGDGSEYSYQMLDGDLEILRNGATGVSSLELGGITEANARRGGFYKDLNTYDMTYVNQLNPNVVVGKHIFKNGAATHMVIDDDGNVGISSTNPQAPLTVAGTPVYDRLVANFGDGLIAASGYQRGVINVNGRVDGTDGRADISFVARTATDSNWLTGRMGMERDGALTFNTGGVATTDATERMRIDSTGNVGIGNSDPDALLSVGRATESGVEKTVHVGLPTIDRGLVLGTYTPSTRVDTVAVVAAQDEFGQLQLRAGGNTAAHAHLTVDNSGCVGVGTTTPNTYGKFVVDSGTGRVILDANTTSTYNTKIGPTDAGMTYKALSNSRGHVWYNGSAGDQELMRITNAGNVGIGDDDPDRRFVAKGAQSIVGRLESTGSIGAQLAFSDSTSANSIDQRFGCEGDDLIALTSGSERMRITDTGNVLFGRTSVSAAATDHGWQVTSNGNVYQYSSLTGGSDVHRWYNADGTLIATINGRGAGYFLGGATYSGPLKADEIIQDGAPVVDSLQIIRAFMKLRAATADPDSTVEELREKLKTAVDDIIDQFQDQIDNMPTPLED